MSTRTPAGSLLVRPRWWALLTVLVLAAAGCASSSSTSAPTTTVPVTLAPVPHASAEYRAHSADWVLPGRDYDNSRSTFDSTLTSATVGHLVEAWRAPLHGALSTVPLIVGDTVYVQDGSGTITAVKRSNGHERWHTKAYGFNIGPFGVAVADGRVFGADGSSGIVAVDAGDGHQLWVRHLSATPTTGVDIQPTVYDGLVLASTVPVSTGGIYTPGDRGVINALDAATGAVRWTFDTVKGDLWGHPEINSGGGAWYPPTVDTRARVVYWGTANPAPFPGTTKYPNGSSRPGDNLYTDSAVALDLDTGKLLWYHQVHPHDIFDRDLVHTMTAHVAGRAVTIATGKGGLVVALDPRTGKQLWSTPVGTHHNDELTALEGPTAVTPGTYGGVLTPPATANGVVYVAVINSPTKLSPDQKAYLGSPLNLADGDIVAIDAATGTIRWDTKVHGDPLGGVTVVNDLAITALLDGTVVALDRESGKVVHRIKAPGGINGWMSAAGDLLVVPVGQATPPSLVAYRAGS